MELKKLTTKVIDQLHKYRYGVLIVCIGLILMLLPPIGTDRKTEEKDTAEAVVQEQSTEEALSMLLMTVEGAGNVRVYLSARSGWETVYQTDTETSTTQDTSNAKTNTVIITDTNREQQGLVRQINPPKYLGAIIVCQGADDLGVKLAIVDAVSKVTGLGANSISVLKMK